MKGEEQLCHPAQPAESPNSAEETLPYTHILRVHSAQLLEYRQVELEEEAEGEGAPELHHTTRGIGGQVQLLGQASTHILQQLLIPGPGREQNVGFLPPTRLHHSVWSVTPKACAK